MILNPQQQKVVDHPGGPLLVLACPGSGKTRCITERIIRLLDEEVRPTSILGVTFTNKAAKEMAERIRERGYGHKLLISTFHSLCVKILRKCGHLIGYKRNFSICDDSAQKSLLIKIIKDKGHDHKDAKFDVRKLMKIIDSKKNMFLSNDEFEFGLDPDYIAIFREYQKTLKLSNSMDFGDLIYNVVKIFEEHPKVRDAYSIKFKHILVDEMQDTNKVQLKLVQHLASYHKNIIAVGDGDQCFPGDTLIDTPTGLRPINSICEGDIVNTLSKPGIIGTSKVTRVFNKFNTNKLLQITLANNTELKCTPNHLIPMDVQIDKNYFVYLMYKKNLGFRVGMCKTSRQGGFAGRLGQEHADAIWVIDACNSKSDASIKEQYYAIKYGIPTIVFHTMGRKIIVNEDQIKWLFKNIDTFSSGRKLLEDKGLDPEIPHHMPRMGASRRGMITMNISLCADRGLHRYSLCTNDKILLEQFGTPRKSKFKNWRIESSTKSSDVINSLVTKVKNTFGDKLNIWMSIKADHKKPLRCQPASNLKIGSFVYRVNENKIERIKVVDIKEISYYDEVYDLDVENTHNYIAGGVIVHNSIYGWRGACIENILKFQKFFPGAGTTHLNTNYRCTPEILILAENLINNNTARTKIKLQAHRDHGSNVSYDEYDEPEDESEGIAEYIANHKWNGYDYKDMAILCRTNMLTRSFEECFRRKGIPHVLIGTFGFYDRKEVKDAISFMKFLANSEDAISFEAIINVPSRGVGPATLVKLLEYADAQDISFPQACRESDKIKGVRKKTVMCLQHFMSVLDKFDKKNPYETLVDIFEDSGFLDHLRYIDRTKQEHREDNVLEFLRGFYNYCRRNANPSVDQYLQEIMLMTSSDKEVADDAVKLMTIHAAKGLEFDIIFVPGLEEDTFPHRRSVAENAVEEERRVCYVAVTRAKDHLHLTRSKTRITDSTPLGTIPSRFLINMGIIDNF